MKRKYCKPVVRKVKLVPSEAVLSACKNGNSGGPQITGCAVVGAGACSVLGS